MMRTVRLIAVIIPVALLLNVVWDNLHAAPLVMAVMDMSIGVVIGIALDASWGARGQR